MKQKKRSLMLGLGLLAISGAAVAGLAVQRYLDDKQDKKIKAALRQYFSQLGEIAVLYVNAYESDDQQTTGGVVMVDGRVYQFVYRDGEIAYQEESHD